MSSLNEHSLNEKNGYYMKHTLYKNHSILLVISLQENVGLSRKDYVYVPPIFDSHKQVKDQKCKIK